MQLEPQTFRPVDSISRRTLFRFVLRHRTGRARICEQWHDSQASAERAARFVAEEWGERGSLSVALVYPVPQMPHALHPAAGAP